MKTIKDYLTTTEARREFYRVTEELLDIAEDREDVPDYDMACQACPYAGDCSTYQLYFGCPVWEDSMGEDL